jgi:hypothetical protein
VLCRYSTSEVRIESRFVRVLGVTGTGLSSLAASFLLSWAAWGWMRYRARPALGIAVACLVASMLVYVYGPDLLGRLITSAVFSLFAVIPASMLVLVFVDARPPAQAALGGTRCADADCGAENDLGAKFCRRCGKALPTGAGEKVGVA